MQFHVSLKRLIDYWYVFVYFLSLCSYNKSCVTLVPELNNTFLNFSPIWNQRANESADIIDESLTGPSLQSGTKLGLFSYLFDRWIKQNLFDSNRYSCCGSTNPDTNRDIVYISYLFIFSFILGTLWVRHLFVTFCTLSVTLPPLKNSLLSSEKNAQRHSGKDREQRKLRSGSHSAEEI